MDVSWEKSKGEGKPISFQLRFTAASKASKERQKEIGWLILSRKCWHFGKNFIFKTLLVQLIKLSCDTKSDTYLGPGYHGDLDIATSVLDGLKSMCTQFTPSENVSPNIWPRKDISYLRFRWPGLSPTLRVRGGRRVRWARMACPSLTSAWETTRRWNASLSQSTKERCLLFSLNNTKHSNPKFSRKATFLFNQ